MMTNRPSSSAHPELVEGPPSCLWASLSNKGQGFDTLSPSGFRVW